MKLFTLSPRKYVIKLFKSNPLSLLKTNQISALNKGNKGNTIKMTK